MVEIYRSDDASAPILNDSEGSFNAMMKAILVDGYGAKAAAGWTLGAENVGIHESILTNADGKNFWLHHDRWRYTDDTSDLYNNFAFIKGVGGFTDVSTHTNGSYPNVIGSAYPDMDTNSQGATINLSISVTFPSGIPWIVVADNNTCYLMIQSTRTNIIDPTTLNVVTDQTWLYSFGSIGLLGDRVDSNIGYVMGFNKAASTATSSAYNRHLYRSEITPVTQYGNYIERNYAGDVGAVEIAMDRESMASGIYQIGYGAKNNVTDSSNGYNYVEVPTPDNKIYMSRWFVKENITANEHTVDPTRQQATRGIFRGAYSVDHSINPAATNNLGEIFDTFTHDGRTYVLMFAQVLDANYTIAFDMTGPW